MEINNFIASSPAMLKKQISGIEMNYRPNGMGGIGGIISSSRIDAANIELIPAINRLEKTNED